MLILRAFPWKATTKERARKPTAAKVVNMSCGPLKRVFLWGVKYRGHLGKPDCRSHVWSRLDPFVANSRPSSS